MAKADATKKAAPKKRGRKSFKETHVAGIAKFNWRGRPPKWETPAALEKLIVEYFESCFELQWFDELQRKPDGTMKKDKKERSVFKPVKRLVQIEPFTVTGLALALGTNRTTLIEYSNGRFKGREKVSLKPKAFVDLIIAAKTTVEQYLEKGTMNGTINAAFGIFSAKCNHKWVEKEDSVLDPDGKIDKKKIDKMTPEQKAEHLKAFVT